MLKKTISMVLILVILFSSFSMIPLSASAEEADDVNPESSAELANTDLTVTGTNSLGTMLAEEYEEKAEDIDDSGNGIYAVEIEGKTARVDVRSFTDAQLIVSVFDEEGKNMYGSGMTDVTPEDSFVELTLEIDTMPPYFLIRAFLMDKITNLPLCKQFENDYYTQKMQEFFAKTTNDFDEDKVLNLDDSEKENFLVYKDDTIIIDNDDENTNVVTKANDKNNEYVIENIDEHIMSLQERDIFSYDFGDGNLLIIKIASIRIDGTTAIIQGDKIEIEEVFDYIRLDTKQGTGEAIVDNSELGDNIEYLGEDIDDSSSSTDLAPTGIELVDIDATLGTSLTYKIAENKTNNIKINGNIGVKIEADIKFFYDAHWFEDDELEISAVLKYELSASIDLELKSKQEVKIPIGRLEFMPVPGLIVRLTPALIVEGTLSMKFKAMIKGQVGFGFEYGQAIDKTKAPTVQTEFKMTGELFIGLSLAPEIALLGDLASAKLDARAGIKLKAEMKDSSVDESKDEIHLCNSCIDGDIFFAIQLKFDFSLLQNKDLTWKFDMLDFEWKICDFYYSFDLDQFGFTECPNRWYKQTITLLDKDHLPLVDASVNGSHTNNKGIVELFLPNGKTAMKISKDGKEVIRWHYIDHAGRFTLVIDFDAPKITGNGVVIGSNVAQISSGQCGNYAYFILYDNGTLDIYGAGQMYDFDRGDTPWKLYSAKVTDIVIEEGITAVGENTFSGYREKNAKRVYIPTTMKFFKRKAFDNCSSLQGVYIKDINKWCNVDSYSSWDHCYYHPLSFAGNLYLNNKLVTEVIYNGDLGYNEAGVHSASASIGSGVFYGCTSLESVTLTDISQICSSVFENCSNLKRVSLSPSIREMWDKAFKNCDSLTTIELPDGLFKIGENAFEGCDNLTDVILHDGLGSIGEYAFSNCKSLESIRIPDTVMKTGNGIFENCTALKNVDFSENVVELGASTFEKCKSLVSFDIPDAVSSIGESCFAYCSALKFIELPSGVETIGKSAFYSCSGLTSLPMSENLTDIGDSAFKYCSGLTSVTLPDHLKSLGNSVFSNCKNLVSVTISGSIAKIGDNSFYYCTSLKNVVLPDSVEIIGVAAFSNCVVLQTIHMPDKLTQIMADAFNYCKLLRDVSLPENLQMIGESAFYGCACITSLTLSDSLKSIGDSAFYGVGITDLVIPSGVTVLGERAFYSCPSLKSVTIEDEHIQIGSKAFAECKKLFSVSAPACVESVYGDILDNTSWYETRIDGCLYLGKVLLGYKGTIPENLYVTSDTLGIADNAFYQKKSLKKVQIPGSVKYIGRCAFYKCTALSDVTLEDGIASIGGYAFEYDPLDRIEIPGSVKNVNCSAFLQCSELLRVVIGEGAETITSGFGSCKKLETIILPDSIVSIPDSFISGTAYYNNQNNWDNGVLYVGRHLIKAGKTVPDNYVIRGDTCSIAAGAFSYSAITGVTIPAGVKIIGKRTFMYCSSLKNVVLSDDLKAIDDEAFYGCTALDGIEIPGKVTRIGASAFEKCSSMEQVKLGASVTEVGASAFYNCSSVKNLVFNNRIETIGEQGFSNCKALETLSLPDSILNIGSLAFSGCASVASVHIPVSLTEIPDGMMQGGKSLTAVSIPYGVRKIGSSAFSNCIGLSSVSIPASVTEIGGFAFEYCSGLTELNLPSNVTVIGSRAFYSCKGLTSVVIPDSVTQIGSAFEWCSSLTSVSIGKGIRYWSGTFYGCTGLTSVSIPDGITYIGSDVFGQCHHLEKVSIPVSLKTIGEGAFLAAGSNLMFYYAGSEDDWSKVRIELNYYFMFPQSGGFLRYKIKYNSEGMPAATGAAVVADAYDQTVLNAYDEPAVTGAAEDIDIAPVGERKSESEDHSFSRSHLVPGSEAVLIILKGLEDSAELNASSLLYIAQGTADENGSVSFDVQQDFGDISWVAYIFGECDHSSSTWTTSKEPASGEEGLKVLTCDHCGAVLDSEGIEALPAEYILGDADGNGEIESVDATFIQRCIAQIPTPYTKAEMMRGDVDGSGDLELTDVTAIQYYLCHLKTQFPIGETVS